MQDISYNPDPLFEQAVATVLHHEGGLVNDPADPGGLTKYGISQRQYPHLDIPNLTPDDARSIYYHDWWERYGYGHLPGPAVATRVFCLAVNLGPGAAHRCLQRALRASGEAITEDGQLGPQTRTACNRVDSRVLVAALGAEAAGYYRTLVARRPVLRRFLAGWLKRAYGEGEDAPQRPLPRNVS